MKSRAQSYIRIIALSLLLLPAVSFAGVNKINGLNDGQQFLKTTTGATTMHMKIVESGGDTHTFSWDATPWRVDQGGTGTTTFTNGSLLFFSSNKFGQNNANLFWDTVNNVLGIGTNALSASSAKLTVKGSLGKSLLNIVSSLGVSQLFVDPDGNTGFGNSTPQHRVDVSGAMYSRLVTASGSSIDWNAGNVQSLTLTSSPTLSFANGQAGGEYKLILKQDGTGGRTVTWPATVKWPGGIAPALTSVPNSTDLMKFIYDGNDYLGSYSLDYLTVAPPPSPPPSINGSITTYPVNTAVTSATFSHTVNSGNNQMLLVAAGGECVGENTGVTFNGTAMTKGNAHGNGTEAYYDYWYRLSPPQGTHDVVANFATCAARQYAAVTIDNVDQTTPFDTDAHTGGLGGNPSVSITTTVPNELILYYLLYDSTVFTYTPGDTMLWTVDNHPLNGYANVGAVHTQASAMTINVGGTTSGSSPWDLIATPIRPAI